MGATLSESLSLQSWYMLKWTYSIYLIRKMGEIYRSNLRDWVGCFFFFPPSEFASVVLWYTFELFWCISKIGFSCVNTIAYSFYLRNWVPLWELAVRRYGVNLNVPLRSFCHLGDLLCQMVGTTFLQATSKLIFLYTICQCLPFWCLRCPAAIKAPVQVSVHFIVLFDQHRVYSGCIIILH